MQQHDADALEIHFCHARQEYVVPVLLLTGPGDAVADAGAPHIAVQKVGIQLDAHAVDLISAAVLFNGQGQAALRHRAVGIRISVLGVASAAAGGQRSNCKAKTQ